MNGTDLPIFGIHHVAVRDFVDFWEQLYSGYDERFYQENIGQPLTENRIEEWFKWKNGKRLSAKKDKGIRRYLSPEEHIDHRANPEALQVFLNRPGGAIWRIFWLHLQHPEHFPIYDQHVHRAMAFILKWPNLKNPDSDPAKIRTYLGDYRTFFFARFDGCNHRKVDRALWSFGRFLKKTGFGRVFQTAPSSECVRTAEK